MKSKLMDLSRSEILEVKGGDCGCNDTFWTRLGIRFTNWGQARGERILANLDKYDYK